jgi:predicted PurR-regulated permease PerM
MNASPSSPRWSTDTKRIVSLIVVALIAYALLRFPIIIPPLLLACLLAYLLSPLAERLVQRLKLRRGLASALVHVLAIALVMVVVVLFVPEMIAQIRSLRIDFHQIQLSIEKLLATPIVIGGQTIDPGAAAQRLGEDLNSLLQSLMREAVGLLVDLAQGALQLILIVVISFYLLKDAPHINAGFDQLAPPSFRSDFIQLRSQIGKTWNAFFRGQLILGVVMGVVVGLTMWALGLRAALLIGILFGLLEVIPNFGPTLASIPTLLIAYFTGSTWLPVSNEVFVIIVLIASIALQQLENLFLVPRIMGYHLNLHPVAVLLAAIAGASLAGVLGILLAAPMLATAREIGRYVYCKMLDVEPFNDVKNKA